MVNSAKAGGGMIGFVFNPRLLIAPQLPLCILMRQNMGLDASLHGHSHKLGVTDGKVDQFFVGILVGVCCPKLSVLDATLCHFEVKV
jgi:hypothetical protein